MAHGVLKNSRTVRRLVKTLLFIQYTVVITRPGLLMLIICSSLA